jgi:hypothetical protein
VTSTTSSAITTQSSINFSQTFSHNLLFSDSTQTPKPAIMRFTSFFAGFATILAVSAAAIPAGNDLSKRTALSCGQVYQKAEKAYPGVKVFGREPSTGGLVQWTPAFGITFSSPYYSILTLTT